MRGILGLFGVSVASALFPLINVEAYLIALVAVTGDSRLWTLSFVGGIGQMVGKIVWYYLGANSLQWGWVRRRVEKPRARAKLELWQERTSERPWSSAGLLAVSAVVGFPPFAIIAILAGQLRMNLLTFIVVGTLGRTLRFAIVLGGAGWAADLMF